MRFPLGFVHAAAAGYSAEASQLFARISDPGTPRKNIMAALVDALVAAGVWTKLDALYLFANVDAATALTSWISATYNAAATGSPTFTADSGYTGASGKYIDSNFNPATASSPKYVLDSANFFGWSLKSGQDTGALLGLITGGASYLYPRYTDDTSYWRINDGTDKDDPSTDGSGLWLLNRSASNALQLYLNGSSTDTGATTSTAVSNDNHAFLRYSATASEAFTGAIACGGFGSSLDATENTALYNALRTYMTAVGVP